MTFNPIPEAAREHHSAVVGKTGSGKTSTSKLIVEAVVAEGARVCVLDPIKSDWWGLISSADGKRPGLPFSVLGGPYGHVPLHESAGTAIGELVATGELPLSIVDMAQFKAGGLQQFFCDFAEALLGSMRGFIYLVLEEAHEFAPKERSGIGAENMAIHWAKKLATAGRSKGIRLLLVTQRTQALHNALLGSCETLIAHRLTAPADQDPIKKWLKANVANEVRSQVEDSLAGLARGTGWVCSGEARMFALQQFPRISTFDNTSTPVSNDEIETVASAAVDRDKLRSIIGAAVEEAEANDPKRLRERIAELEKERKVERANPLVDGAVIEEARAESYARGVAQGEALIAAAAARKLRDLASEFEAIELTRVDGLHRSGAVTPVHAAATPDSPSLEALTPGEHANHHGLKRRRRPRAAGGDGEARILAALSPTVACSWEAVALRAGYVFTGGGFRQAKGALIDRGAVIESSGKVLAPPGAGEPEPMSLDDLIDKWAGRSPFAVGAMLNTLRSKPAAAMEIASLANANGYVASGGGFRKALKQLRNSGLVEQAGSSVRLSRAFLEAAGVGP